MSELTKLIDEYIESKSRMSSIAEEILKLNEETQRLQSRIYRLGSLFKSKTSGLVELGQSSDGKFQVLQFIQTDTVGRSFHKMDECELQ